MNDLKTTWMQRADPDDGLDRHWDVVVARAGSYSVLGLPSTSDRVFAIPLSDRAKALTSQYRCGEIYPFIGEGDSTAIDAVLVNEVLDVEYLESEAEKLQ